MIHFFALALLAQQPTPSADCTSRTPAARAALDRGDAAAAHRAPRDAARAFDEGLTALGNAYWRTGLVDDTGMRLVLAKVAIRNGRLNRGAMLKRRVLIERLAYAVFQRAANPCSRAL